MNIVAAVAVDMADVDIVADVLSAAYQYFFAEDYAAGNMDVVAAVAHHHIFVPLAAA